MIDGECRMALLTLPLDAQPVPPSGGTFPRPSANLVSGTPASSFILGFKSAPPPKGYRAVGPVRVPGIFNGSFLFFCLCFLFLFVLFHSFFFS